MINVYLQVLAERILNSGFCCGRENCFVSMLFRPIINKKYTAWAVHQPYIYAEYAHYYC